MGARVRLACIAIALAGCGLGIVGTAIPDDGGAPDGGAPVDAATDTPAEDVTTIRDAVAPDDGGRDDGGCTLLVADDFSSPDPRWIREGDAVFTGGVASLVTPDLQHHGAIFIPVVAAVAAPTSFKASFKMLVGDAGGAPGDGITLAWATDVVAPPIGGTGSQLGFCPDGNSANVGPKGAALAFHTSSPIGISPRESNGVSCGTIPGASGFTFKDTQTITATVTGAAVTTSADLQSYVFTLAAAVPIRWVGFTSATGGAVARYAVDDVTIRICP